MTTTFKSFLKLNEAMSKYNVAWAYKHNDIKADGVHSVTAVNSEDAEKEAMKRIKKDSKTRHFDFEKGKLTFRVKQVTTEEAEITQANFHQLAKLDSDSLKDTKNWQLVKAADAEFADKLLRAWEGDARVYKKTGKVDSLFLKMTDPKNIEKLSKIKMNDAVEKNFERMDMLFMAAMPEEINIVPMDKDVWKDDPVREYFDLKNQVEKLITESKK